MLSLLQDGNCSDLGRRQSERSWWNVCFWINIVLGPTRKQAYSKSTRTTIRMKKGDLIDKTQHYPIIRSLLKFDYLMNICNHYSHAFLKHMPVWPYMNYMRKTTGALICTKSEMLKFYGIHVMMGILSYPRNVLETKY